MKISTSTGGIAQAGRGISRQKVGGKPLTEEEPQAAEAEPDGDLPDFAAFGARTPPRGTFINILA